MAQSQLASGDRKTDLARHHRWETGRWTGIEDEVGAERSALPDRGAALLLRLPARPGRQLLLARLAGGPRHVLEELARPGDAAGEALVLLGDQVGHPERVQARPDHV